MGAAFQNKSAGINGKSPKGFFPFMSIVYTKTSEDQKKL